MSGLSDASYVRRVAPGRSLATSSRSPARTPAEILRALERFEVDALEPRPSRIESGSHDLPLGVLAGAHEDFRPCADLGGDMHHQQTFPRPAPGDDR